MAQTRIPFKVEMADGQQFDVTADLRDMRNWERNNKGRAFTEEPVPLERLNYVAWSAARRNGLFTASFNEFDKNVVSLDQPDEEPDDEADADGLVEVEGELYEHDEVRPTEPTPGVGSSSSLP